MFLAHYREASFSYFSFIIVPNALFREATLFILFASIPQIADVPCPESKYSCEMTPAQTRRLCITASWKCDGAEDCPLGDDEKGCPTYQPPTRRPGQTRPPPVVEQHCRPNDIRCVWFGLR